MHIVFRNRLALIMTLLGGLLFGFRFLQTNSLFVTSFERALYGVVETMLDAARHYDQPLTDKRPFV